MKRDIFDQRIALLIRMLSKISIKSKLFTNKKTLLATLFLDTIKCLHNESYNSLYKNVDVSAVFSNNLNNDDIIREIDSLYREIELI